ncbi:MAG: argininosuccinate lyase [Bdellovibrionales bacterium]|nr:argininosuccinate lyase [Bdellovibrionales bacterium]
MYIYAYYYALLYIARFNLTTLWGGRFTQSAHSDLWNFTVSHEDRRLLSFDIQASMAHVKMLAHCHIIPESECDEILKGLGTLLEESETNRFVFLDTDEDIHSAVERRLKEIIGDVAGKLHTGRSRNDQILVDLKLYLLQSARNRTRQLRELIKTFVAQADKTKNLIAPVYTHLQQAQAVSFAHHLLAYAWMFKRDLDRFNSLIERLDISPLGACAGGGTSLGIDPKHSANMLGFKNVFRNSIDTVASRDFVSEYAFCVSQSMIHLSRLGEEIILWSTKEFNWITLPDELTTGSSMLPQKKNPDMAELLRGKCSGAIGDLVAILSLQKNLPLAYNRDLQEDKTYLFRSDDTLEASLKASHALIASAKFHPKEPDPMILAIDLAERLVKKGVPFRSAHQMVGQLVLSLEKTDKSFSDVASTDLESQTDNLTFDDLRNLNLETSLRERQSYGGGSIASVERQIGQLLIFLEEGQGA